MELDPCVEENDTPLLIDSGTESTTESPLEHSEDLTVCDIEIIPGTTKTKVKLSLIDKSFSIDENELCTPLEPTHFGTVFPLSPSVSPNSATPDDTTSEEDDGIEDIIHLEVDKSCLKEDMLIETDEGQKEQKASSESSEISDCSEIDIESITSTPRTSILRKPSDFDASIEGNILPSSRHVYFPNDDHDLITYKEPEDHVWIISNFISSEEILQIYENSCKKHKTIELDTIKSQIQEIKNNTNHSAILKLASIKITPEVTDTLEEVLKVTNFHTLILQECQFTPQTMTEFLNSLEYYNSVCHFEISMSFEDDDTWKCFCSACSKIEGLKSLSFKGMVISESYMRLLINAIRNNENISVLKFDGCMLVKLPSFYLGE